MVHVLFKLKDYFYIISVFSCSISIFSTQTFSFSLNKGEKYRRLENSKLLAENDQVIETW